MRAIEVLPAELRARSRHAKRIVVSSADAEAAIAALLARGWAVECVTRRPEDGADLRSDRPGWIESWQRIETWAAYLERCAADAHAKLAGWASSSAAWWAEIEARGPSAHVDATRALLARFYPEGARYHEVLAGAEAVPVVAARLERATRTFSAGQVVLVYDGYWGMNENAKVLGRYRRKQRWVRGVCPIDILVDCRPRIERKLVPRRLLEGASIPGDMFRGRFWPMPQGPDEP